MASINKVILVGNLGADPERRAFTNGDAVCELRLATNERRKDWRTEEVKEVTEWHKVVLYRRLAEVASEYLRKGATVYIEGRLRTRKWNAKDGIERQTTEIEATDMKMLSRRDEIQVSERQVSSAMASRASFTTLHVPAPPPKGDWDDPPF